MENKGLRAYLLMWWRQPFDFDWLGRHLGLLGLQWIHQFFVGCFALIYGASAVLTITYASFDGGGAGNLVLVGAIVVFSLAIAARCFWGPWPTERSSLAFIVAANVSVVAVIAVYFDAFTAMPGLALLAANGIYVAILHGPRVLMAHLVFTATAFAVMYLVAVHQHHQAVSVITIRLLVLLPTTLGIPVIVQSYLLALRVGVADAMYDPLTGLHNRRGLHDEIGRMAPADGTWIGVLAIDIDKFKAINDTHGHDTGDRVLVAVANATRDALAPLAARSVIARTGGEEFVVVVEGSQLHPARIAERVHQCVAGCPADVVPTVSVGTALARTGPHGVRAVVRDLMDRADSAMYRAKHAGGSRTVADDRSEVASDD
jgi:diguanylate cyclase (GGDEF)-like protein